MTASASSGMTGTALTEEEQLTLAARELPPRLAAWAERMGVMPQGLRITRAKKRLGSCSADNRICLSAALVRWPDCVVDYVVVHELAHIRHKNHSAAFYAEIAKILPDWKERRKQLFMPAVEQSRETT